MSFKVPALGLAAAARANRSSIPVPRAVRPSPAAPRSRSARRRVIGLGFAPSVICSPLGAGAPRPDAARAYQPHTTRPTHVVTLAAVKRGALIVIVAFAWLAAPVSAHTSAACGHFGRPAVASDPRPHA